jgi:rubredoxin
MAEYQCPDCGFIYSETVGHQHEGFKPGTLFSDLPNDFSCPNCFVRDKEDFIPLKTNHSHQG